MKSQLSRTPPPCAAGMWNILNSGIKKALVGSGGGGKVAAWTSERCMRRIIDGIPFFILTVWFGFEILWC